MANEQIKSFFSDQKIEYQNKSLKAGSTDQKLDKKKDHEQDQQVKKIDQQKKR